MALIDALRNLLATGEQLIDDPAIRQGVANDLALLEAKAAEGIGAAEAHVAAWLAGHYYVAAPSGDAPQPVTGSPEPVAGPAPAGPADVATVQPAPAAQDAAPSF